MTGSVNLMTERAQLRTAAERITRLWALVIGALILLLVPVAGWTWRQRCEVVERHEALDASYEPIRRLAAINRGLSTDATELVAREKAPLMLARNRSVLVPLGIVADAVAEGEGAVAVKHLVFSQKSPTTNDESRPNRLTLEAVTRTDFDVSQFTDALQRPPITDVKITSSATASQGDVVHKLHSIECEF